ncbi:Uncharacterized protein OBRU01_24328 [Operophtera brumata]|uniref:Transposable element Tc3 transposase n=1 Tax=Operophtera brumata TaxID=104452 RepID=A0A0L7KMQ7_OPEBR|nr:Uncharacterized protein OBRU01_24328 [Operophtera brumata]
MWREDDENTADLNVAVKCLVHTALHYSARTSIFRMLEEVMEHVLQTYGSIEGDLAVFERSFDGILNGQVLGPFELPATLNAEGFFLSSDLPTLLEDVSLEDRRRMWLQHDGCPAHYARNVLVFLNETYPRRWIGRLGTILWPPWSPDLKPLDFFYWGCIKEIVYREPRLSSCVNVFKGLPKPLLNPDMHAK